MKRLRVIVGCEFTQTVCKAFRSLGHDAYSCDLLPCEGGHPEWHYQEDILQVLKRERFDLGVFHPSCTYLCNSGVRWLFNKDGSRNAERWQKMVEGALFFKAMLNASIDKIAVENPIMHRYAKEIIGVQQTQIIQPWQFGHGETKATCLWLKGLPKLVPTNIVEGREQRLHRLPPSPDRWKERSRTFEGIGKAMAMQWGGVVSNDRYMQLSLFEKVAI